jgi:hypothetical protein
MAGTRVWRGVAVAAGLGVVLVGCDLGKPPTTYGTGHAVSAVAAGDVDGDGDVDAVATCACPSLSLLRNDGAGSFVVTTGPSGLAAASDATLIDLDGDGDLDLSGTGTLAAPGNPTGVFVALGDGTGGFGAPSQVPGSLHDDPPRPDVTGDGVPDMVHVPQFDNDVRLRAGDGAGGFGPLTVTPLAGVVATGGVTFADMDGDGDDDLVASGTPTVGPSNAALVAPNDGAGAFGPAVATQILGAASLEPAVADLNGDGVADIVATIVEINGAGRPYLTDDVSVLIADGLGGFEPAVLQSLPGAPTNIGSAAINGDDKLDLVFTSLYVDETWVAFGDGTGGFAARPPVKLASSADRAAAIADVDGDGASDVLTPRPTDVAVFLNRL